MTGSAATESATPRKTGGRFAPLWRIVRPLLGIPTPVVFLAASAVAGMLLWRQGSLSEIGIALRSTPPAMMAGVLLMYATSILVLGLRWHCLVRMVGGAPPWTDSVEVFLTSVIVNYAAPIGLAVPTRAALTVRDLRVTPSQSVAVVGWEIGLDIAMLSTISLAWLVSGGAAALDSFEAEWPMLAATVLGAGLGLLVLAIAARGPIGSRIKRHSGQAIAFARDKPKLAAAAVAMTIGFWVVQSAIMAGLLNMVGVTPTPSLLLGVMGLPVLIGMLSPVPGGAGVREGLMAAAASIEGIAVGPVVLAAITYRLALFVVTPLVWIVVRGWRAHAPARP